MIRTSEQEVSTTLEAIWGNRLLDEGFLGIPNLVVRNYRQLGIEHGEFGLICTILTYKHDGRDPYPSHDTLAEHLQCSTRQVRKWIDSLEAKQLLKVGRRRNKESKQLGPMVYNFHPLIDAALQLVGEKPLPESADQWDIEYQTPLEPEVPNLGPEVPVNRLINRLKDDAYDARAKENFSTDFEKPKDALGNTVEPSSSGLSQAATQSSIPFPVPYEPSSNARELCFDPLCEDCAAEVGNPEYQGIETLATSLLVRPMLNALEMNMIDDLLQSGIGADTIEQGIRESFEQYQPKFGKDRIRSLQYCEPRILELHAHKEHVPQALDTSAVSPSPKSSRKSWGSSRNNVSIMPDYLKGQPGKYERFYQVFGHATDKPGVYQRE
nr:helix-turn-helix domain-containing protein [Bacilli bacterium]